jgi:hydroxyacylglutathione hydrolase
MSTSLEIVRIPVLSDNYVWLMREPQSGYVGVVDPAVAAPVLARPTSGAGKSPTS